jgi:hypothetical protein
VGAAVLKRLGRRLNPLGGFVYIDNCRQARAGQIESGTRHHGMLGEMAVGFVCQHLGKAASLEYCRHYSDQSFATRYFTCICGLEMNQ